MGCDGGTIPRRDELVRVQKKPEQKDKDAEREFRWHDCALTQQRLQEPIVMCGLGRLYSKQNVIEQLLEKDKMPKSAQHIKTMKDIRTLNLTPNPSYADEDKTEGLLDARHSPYICKLIGLEMTGKFRFIALWTCGCVMSERALKLIKSTASVCPLCQTTFSVEDVIVLNGGIEDLEVLQVKMEMRNAKRKASKKDKKEKDKLTNAAEKLSTVNCTVTTTATEILLQDDPSTSKVAAQNVTDIQDVVTDASKISSKIKINGNSKRINNLTDSMQDPDIKRLKTDYSVARDPRATDVYKSLFTTHKSEQEQTRAHWVTYNPFYN